MRDTPTASARKSSAESSSTPSTRSRRRTEALLLLLLLWAGATGTAQQQQQPAVTFRADVNFVEVHAVVTDERGAFVADLSKEDFEILEDGKAHTATVFSLVDLPEGPATTPRDALRPVDPDVRATTGDSDGRIYVIVLDDLHTAFDRSQVVRGAATRFVTQHFGPNDLAAIAHTSGRQDAAQELTTRRALLLAAIDKFQGRKLPSAGAEKLAVHNREQQAGSAMAASSGDAQELRTAETLQQAQSMRDPNDAERGLNARRTLELVEGVAEGLADIRGRRKALLLFSEGIDYDIYEPFNRGSASAIVSYAREAVAAAQRANVSVYAIDPRGLATLGGEGIGVAGLSNYPQLEFGTARGFVKELLLAQESLISLADETGGMALVNTSDVGAALARIVLDTSRYYLLGYRSHAPPGRFQKIEVRVRRPGVRVRARRGHVPPDPKAAAKAARADVAAGTTPALKAALNIPVPAGDLPLRVFAAPFKGSGRNASVLVAIEIDGRSLQFEERDGRFIETLEVSIVAVDHRSKVQGGDRQIFNLKLLPETLARVQRTGVRLMTRLDLPPARYQIRIGAHESVGGTIGTLPYDLEVQDYSRTPFSLSGIVLTSSSATSLVTPETDPQLSRGLPAPPSAVRTFAASETLSLFAEAYQSGRGAVPVVHFRARVENALTGQAVFETTEERRNDGSGSSPTHWFTADFPLKDLGPGSYVLRVEARATAESESLHREVPFEVVSR